MLGFSWNTSGTLGLKLKRSPEATARYGRSGDERDGRETAERSSRKIK